MDYIFHEHGESGYVECLPGGGRVESERDALDLVAACGEHGTANLLLPADCLSGEFFRLGSGLAGAVLFRNLVRDERVDLDRIGSNVDLLLGTNR